MQWPPPAFLSLLTSNISTYFINFLYFLLFDSAEDLLNTLQISRREKRLYWYLFWSVISRIWTRITPNTETFHAVL